MGYTGSGCIVVIIIDYAASLIINYSGLFLFLGVYAALGFSQALFVLVGAFCLALGAFKASQTLHEKLLFSIIRHLQCLSFFDTTPLGI